MIIKDDVKLTIDNQFLNIKYDKCFAKKITSSQYPALIGIDDFNGKGEKTMSLLNLLEREDIDPYWLYRGDIAESLAYEVIRDTFVRRYGERNVEVILFDSKDYTYGDQWAYNRETGKGNQFFGGRVDIGIKVKMPNSDEIKRIVVEVKGKTYEKHYEMIVGDVAKNIKPRPPITEIEQGKFLATMMNLSSVTMVWVFFNEEQEIMLREMQSRNQKFNGEIKASDVKMHFQLFEFDRNLMVQDMSVASKGLQLQAKEKRIPLFFFNDKEREIINNHIEEHHKRERMAKAEEQRIGSIIDDGKNIVDKGGENENDNKKTYKERDDLPF